MLSFTLLVIGSLELFATLVHGLVYHNNHLADSFVHNLEGHSDKAVPSRSLEGSPSLHRSLRHQLKPGVHQAESIIRVAVISIIQEATGATTKFPTPSLASPQITKGPTSRPSLTATPRESGWIAEKSLASSPNSFSSERHGDRVSPSHSIPTVATLTTSTAPSTTSTTTQVVRSGSSSVSSSRTSIGVSVTSDTVVSQTSSSSPSVSYSHTSNGGGTSSTVSNELPTNNGSQLSAPYPTASSKSSNATTSPPGSFSSMAPQRASGMRNHHAPFPSSSLTVPPVDSTAAPSFDPSSAKKLGHSTATATSKSQDPAESSTFAPNYSSPSPAFVSSPASSSEMHIPSIPSDRSQSVASATAAVTPNAASSKTGLSSGGVIGIVVGVVLLLSVLSGFLFYFCRCLRMRRDVGATAATPYHFPSQRSFPPDSEKALRQNKVVEVPHVGKFLMATAGVDDSGMKSETSTRTPQIANLAASFDEDRWSVSRMLATYSFPRPPVQGSTTKNAAALADHELDDKPAGEDDFFVISM